MISIQSPELVALLERLAASSERQANALEAISFALQTYGAVQVERDPPEDVPFTASPAPAASADHSSPVPETQVNPVPFAPQQPTSPAAAAALDFISGRTSTPPGGTPAAAPATAGHPWSGQPIPGAPAPAGSPTPWETAAPAPSVSADAPWNKPPA